MEKKPQVAAFEGGKLHILDGEESSREAVLALPLSRLLVKMVRVPADRDPVEFSTPILQAMSPFPDEPLTVSCETVRADDAEKIVIAAALPESATDDIGEALDAAKLNVVRIDALTLGQLRGDWGKINVADGCRRLIKIKSEDCLSLIVLDGDQPVSIRAITDETELKRETMLSLLEAEDFGGAKELKETLEFESSEAALEGVAVRSMDDAAFNAMPASWSEMLEETRFKAKLIKYMAIAGGIWLMIMGVLFGVPVVYGFMTDHQKSLSKAHARQYKEVVEMKQKVDVISKYSDHDRGALEIMKAISDRLPEGITLTSWDYKRGEGVRISGEADQSSQVYEFKDTMAELEAGEVKVFPKVSMGPLSSAKGGKQRFTLELGFEESEEEE